VLSQNTSDINSGRAYAALRAAFPSWDALAAARPEQIERVIRSGGLARLKSRRLTQLLAAVKRREGRYDLRGLRRLPSELAEARLRGLPGVGPKTLACVLLFHCGHVAFPVDTHVHRISNRLGFVRTRTPEQTEWALRAKLPRRHWVGLNDLLVAYGQNVCQPVSPHCTRCRVRARCHRVGVVHSR